MFFTNKDVRTLVEHLKKDVNIEMSLQRRPVTIVLVTCDLNGTQVPMLGYSKVCWPDKWDEEKGLNIAVDRAITWFVRDNLREITGVIEQVIQESVDKEAVPQHVIERLEEIFRVQASEAPAA